MKIIRVVGCIVHYKNEVLLLHRSKTETDPSLWGIPAGKVEAGENDIQACIREIFEETNIRISESQLRSIGQLDIQYEGFVVEFPMFYMKFDKAPVITLDPREHIGYKWLTPKQVLEMPDLMLDVGKIIQKFCIDKLSI